MVYGLSTMLVYTTGHGVNGFTLDPSIGTYYLSHPNMQYPKDGTIYSINEGNYVHFPQGVKDYLKYCQALEGNRPYTSRYIGSLVSDFHRNMLKVVFISTLRERVRHAANCACSTNVTLWHFSPNKQEVKPPMAIRALWISALQNFTKEYLSSADQKIVVKKVEGIYSKISNDKLDYLVSYKKYDKKLAKYSQNILQVSK